MNKFKKGDYIILKHPDLAYSEEDEELDVCIDYRRLYNKYKNRRHKIISVDEDSCQIFIDSIPHTFYFNEITLARPNIINKIKVL